MKNQLMTYRELSGNGKQDSRDFHEAAAIPVLSKIYWLFSFNMTHKYFDMQLTLRVSGSEAN